MKTIPRFPNYSVTKDGRVWSKKRLRVKGRWLSPCKSKRGGYRIVNLHRQNKGHTCGIHRLVLQTFVGPCPPGKECRHLDGDPLNNNLDNLKWGTRGENMQDAVQHGTHPSSRQRGEKSSRSKLSDRERRLIHSRYLAGGCTQQKLANEFGVYHTTIGKIAHNSRWGAKP